MGTLRLILCVLRHWREDRAAASRALEAAQATGRLGNPRKDW